MNELKPIPAPGAALWRELRYRWLPWVVFASLVITMGWLWHEFILAKDISQAEGRPVAGTEGMGAAPKCKSLLTPYSHPNRLEERRTEQLTNFQPAGMLPK